ncbi:MAG: S41 family peptidase [Vicinamibacterales bacterium]
MRRVRVVAAVCLVLVGVAPAFAQSGTCSALTKTTFVRDTLDELYYWYRELPDLDPARFATPEAFLEAARYRPLDRTFSFVTSRAASDAFFSESQFIGLGLTTSQIGGELRVLQVFEGSPAAEAGLDRGSRIDTIDGASVADLITAGTVDAAFGVAQDGLVVTVGFETRGGDRRTAAIRKRAVTIPTVSLTQVFEVDGRRIGYLFFRNFVRPSVAALDSAFDALRAARVDELVLDLRYNGGGLVDVAVQLASLIAGDARADAVFAESRHNDRNRRLNETLRFTAPANALSLSRVIVIATRASASASELVMNGLRPFMPVVVVGDRTYGKPVGQYQLPFCDKVLAPVSFAMVNAAGEGDYYDGLPVTCAAADDITHDLGDPAEASLREALHYVSAGACSAAPVTGALRQRADTASDARLTGWRSVVNAQ